MGEICRNPPRKWFRIHRQQGNCKGLIISPVESGEGDVKTLKDLEERDNCLPFVFCDFVLKYLWCMEFLPGQKVSLILLVFR